MENDIENTKPVVPISGQLRIFRAGAGRFTAYLGKDIQEFLITEEIKETENPIITFKSIVNENGSRNLILAYLGKEDRPQKADEKE